MPDYLFVYGTLKKRFQSEMGRFLRSNSTFIGKGKIKGKLYDLGKYPGLTISAADESWVYGEVYKLHNAIPFFVVLDEYEGNEYSKQQIDVILEQSELRCWVYLFKRGTTIYPLISAGIY